VPLRRNGTSVGADFKYLLHLRRLMQALSPDLVVSYTVKPNIWGSLAARSLSIRSISMVTGAGYVFGTGSGLRRKAISWLSRSLYRLATSANDLVIFQNQDDVQSFETSGALADVRKARLVSGSGVPMDHFVPAPLPGGPAFLMIARLLVSKGVAEYAEACRILRRKGYSWPVRIAGFYDEGPDGVSRKDVEAWQAEGLEYLGPLDDVREAIASASVYVLPSYAEGTPRSVLEAMAMGRPIVTTDAPGCRETVTPGVNGILVPVRDARALAEAMEELGQSEAERARMGRESARIARERFDVEKVNEAMVQILGLS
jgi:glycosyltransferase involved in cell wall biosynthesis